MRCSRVHAVLVLTGFAAAVLGSSTATALPFDGSSSATAGVSAKQILTDYPFAPDGIYWLDPDGPGAGGAAFMAFADMTTDGGGWTLGALSFDATPLAAINITLSVGTASLGISHSVAIAELGLNRDAQIRYQISNAGGLVFSGSYVGRFDDVAPTFTTSLDSLGLNGSLDASFNFHAPGNDLDVSIYVRELVSPATVPEPSTGMLVAVGLVGLATRRDRRA
jgi:hypothetical protein